MNSPMATKAVSSCSILRPSAYPPLSAFLSRRLFPILPPSPRSALRLSQALPSNPQIMRFYGGHSSCDARSLVDYVMEERKAMRFRKRARAMNKVDLSSAEEMVEDNYAKRFLQKGCLLEFRKDSQKFLLAVAQKPDGKKNWMVCDQNGVMSSIKPQQVTFVIPGIVSFDHTDIPEFIEKAQNLLDPSILECAWKELLENKRSVTPGELAEIIYGSREALESYCAHLLLSDDEIYFNKIESKGSLSIYEPRPTLQVLPGVLTQVFFSLSKGSSSHVLTQVEELIHRKHLKEASKKELDEFVQLVMSAKTLPRCSKPSKCSWLKEEKYQQWITSLKSYAVDACKDDEQKKTAGNILKSLGLSRTSSAAVNLLIDIGYFPVHVNLDILKSNISTEVSDEVLLAVENLLTTSADVDEASRKDLSSLKVYAIDVDEADELDDALSAMKLPDGRIKVWIHVADPACLIEPHSIIDREAMQKGTSIFLPTATIPMFPEKLAMQGMSLQQGKLCKAVSVSVTLNRDGSIADYSIDNSMIRPTYMLTYESASELLHLGLEEEADLRLLSEAASLRLQWRCSQGAVDTPMIEPRVKVVNPDDPEPLINLYVEDQSDPAMRLVSEMMILCGEIVATFGSVHNIPLPYRGQPQSSISMSAFAHLPEGPVRSSAYVRIMRAAELNFNKPIRHGVLGIPGYVQFTSPIRRYVDLLAHYQIKSFLRGEAMPFSSGELEGIAFLVNLHVRVAKKLQSSSLRYWLLEYFVRQSSERKFSALILRFVKDRVAALLLVEVGIEASASVSVGKQIGDEIQVIIEEAHPRDDVLLVREV